jgi:transposase-like protein
MAVTIQTTEQVTCKNCGSTAVVKFGTYKGVQRYFCKSCKRKFKGDNALFHMKVAPEYVSSALSNYYSGLSIGDVSKSLKQEHGYQPSKHIVYNWIDKYTDIAVNHFRDNHPTVGDVWIADETVLKIDGQNVWVYDIIDTKTRFLLASRIALSRTTHQAQMLMEEASRKAGKVPKEVITDKNTSYLDGIELAFGADTEHKQSRPFVSKDSTNMIERYHGTLKERTKVMRGLKDIGSAQQFLDGFMVNYNYFRPHEALEGKTPAEVAKVDYSVKNWADLTRLPVSKGEEVKSHGKRIVLRVEKPGYQPPKVASPSKILGQFAGRQRISPSMPRITKPTPKISNAIYGRGGLVSRHPFHGAHKVRQGRRGRGIVL